jgi:hypothetical protein
MALAVIIGGFSFPSEVIGPTSPYSQFYFVLGYHALGLILTVLISAAAALSDNPLDRRAAAMYLPLILLIVINPLGWKLASLATGNLGFRIFWCFPGPLIGGIVIARLLQQPLGTGRSVPSVLVGASALVGGISANAAQGDGLRVRWGAPGLRVDREAYSEAQRIDSIAPKSCALLAPERVAVWLSVIPDAPHLVVVRTIYLTHYRFTEPTDELALRWRLSHLVNGQADGSPLPTQSALLAHHIRIGMIVADENNSQMTSLKIFADDLGLRERRIANGMRYWTGACRE